MEEEALDNPIVHIYIEMEEEAFDNPIVHIFYVSLPSLCDKCQLTLSM